MPKLISRIELQQRLAASQPPTLVEALPEKYYLDGHLPGALHLPHTEVAERAPCQNSHIAAKLLEQRGYTDVSVFAGGKQDWADAGLALEKEALAA